MKSVDRIASFACGLLFGVGLLVSGMTDPAKVEGFLDLAGAWDPSLALVMGGAIGVGVIGFAVARRRSTTLIGTPMVLPNRREIDARLVLGSLTFGVGWCIAGFCPGPAIVSIGTGSLRAVLFTIAMLGGMVVFRALESVRAPRTTTGTTQVLSE